MKSRINTYFNRFVASVLLVFAVFQTNAQVYPVQVTVVTTPPYYNYLAHYGDQNNHLQIIATFTDFASPPVNVRLRLTIEGAGFVVRTRQDIPVGQLYTLSPGVPVFIQGSDVLPYLTENSLELISGNVDLDNLPEGFTTVCVEVVNDGINAEVLSDKSCTAFFLQYMQPPQAFLPICSSTVDTTQLFQTFQWSPPQNYLPTVGSDLTYNFSLYEWIDTNNYNIFQTGQGLVYQTQTTFPMVQVSNFDVLWQTGRKYVWRVQAQLTSNGLPVQMFTQNGLSAPCSFYYGQPQSLAEQLTGGLTINVTAEALASRKGRALWTVTDETPGEGLSSYTSYIVEYRRKPYPGENYIYNWLYDTVYAQQQPIWRLEPEETYQVRVSGIAGDFVSEPSDIVEFTTPPLRDYACGEADLPYLSPNYTPLLSAAMGDVFQIGQFELEVTYIEPLGQVGHYRGRGVIKHDFIGGAKVKVKFDDLLVDNQFVVREGMATAVTSGVDEWLHDQYAQFVEPVYVPGVIDSVYVTDSTAFAVVNGQVLTFEFDPPDYPIILQDENGNQYTIYPGGTITVSTYLNVTDEFLGATAAMAVHFSENANDNYGFDKKQYMPWHANYEIIRLADSTNYFVANKSAVVGQTTVVNATINTQLFPVGTVEFKLGTTVLSSTVLNPQQGLIQVSIPSQSTTGELTVYAYSDNVSLGKLNLFVYDAKPLNVVVVPVASATIDETTLNTYLNDVFNDAGVNITATVETAFTTPEIGATTTIQVSDATLMRKYSPQMRTLRDAYFEEHAKEDNTYYLFVVAGLTDSAGAQIDGYMVRGKQVGFIASGSSFVTYAHELGHGMGALQHSWLNNGPQQASTNNLMDYNDSTHLIKSQWEWLQDPPTVAGVWDDEGDNESQFNQSLISELLPLKNQNNTFTFLDPAGGIITIPISGLSRIVLSDNFTYIGFSENTRLNVPAGVLMEFDFGGKTYKSFGTETQLAGFAYENGSSRVYYKDSLSKLIPANQRQAIIGFPYYPNAQDLVNTIPDVNGVVTYSIENIQFDANPTYAFRLIKPNQNFVWPTQTQEYTVLKDFDKYASYMNKFDYYNGSTVDIPDYNISYNEYAKGFLILNSTPYFEYNFNQVIQCANYIGANPGVYMSTIKCGGVPLPIRNHHQNSNYNDPGAPIINNNASGWSSGHQYYEAQQPHYVEAFKAALRGRTDDAVALNTELENWNLSDPDGLNDRLANLCEGRYSEFSVAARKRIIQCLAASNEIDECDAGISNTLSCSEGQLLALMRNMPTKQYKGFLYFLKENNNLYFRRLYNGIENHTWGAYNFEEFTRILTTIATHSFSDFEALFEKDAVIFYKSEPFNHSESAFGQVQRYIGSTPVQNDPYGKVTINVYLQYGSGGLVPNEYEKEYNPLDILAIYGSSSYNYSSQYFELAAGELKLVPAFYIAAVDKTGLDREFDFTVNVGITAASGVLMLPLAETQVAVGGIQELCAVTEIVAYSVQAPITVTDVLNTLDPNSQAYYIVNTLNDFCNKALLFSGGVACISGLDNLATKIRNMDAAQLQNIPNMVQAQFREKVRKLRDFALALLRRSENSNVATLFNVGDQIAGKTIVRVRRGTNGKIAIIGRKMNGHVEVAADALRLDGKPVEIFSELDQKYNLFNIDGSNKTWQDIVDDFGNSNGQYQTNEMGWILDSELPNTMMYKANQIWAEKLIAQGYTIIDIGYPSGQNLPQSVFYNMELSTLFP